MVFSFLLLGCDKPEETPELKDKVFLSFQSEVLRVEREISGKEKEVEEQKKVLDSLLSVDGEKKLARQNILELQTDIFKLRQKKLYFEYSVDSRRLFVRKKSLEAFKKNQTWKSEKSSLAFMTNKKLSEAPKTWLRGQPGASAEIKKQN